MDRFFRWVTCLPTCVLLVLTGIPRVEAQTYQWTTLAGSRGGPGFVDGPPGLASFNRPAAVAVDDEGSLYLAELGNHTIRKISSTGMVSTVAGKGGIPGASDGVGQDARFKLPSGLAVDNGGALYVSDLGNHTIRKILPSGQVITIAGQPGVSGLIDGHVATARFHSPAGLAVAPDGSILVADGGNHSIRRITADGMVSTVAGGSGLPGYADGPAESARFYSPSGVAIGGDGVIYVADSENCLIRRISAQGDVTTYAGTLYAYDHADGIGTAAAFASPTALVVDAEGVVFVSDSWAMTIRRIDPGNRMVTTLAGDVGQIGFVDGSPGRFGYPFGMAIRSDGTLLVADSDNHALRSVNAAGVVGTVAASLERQPGATDGAGDVARFRSPYDLAVGDAGAIFVADTGNRTVRRVSSTGEVTTIAGTAGLGGTADGTGAAARFSSLRGITAGPGGLVHVADVVTQEISTIRKITAQGAVTTLAGAPESLPPQETLYLLTGLATQPSGNIIATDISAVRKITPTGVASFIAGSKRIITYYSGGSITAWKSGSLDGTGTAATFYQPSGVAADASYNLFVTESGGCVVRKISPYAEVTTLAGKARRAGDAAEFRDGSGSEARFNSPEGIAVDTSGNLYVADTGSHTIRKVTPAGVVTTIGGLPGYAGAGDGSGDRALFSQPSGISVDSMGNVYVADRANHRIVKGTPLPFPELVVQAADGRHLATGDPGISFGNVPTGTTSVSQTLRVWNTGNAPLDISGVTMVGEQAARFGIDRSGLPAAISPGGSGVIRVTANPIVSGPIEAFLRISNNDADEPEFEVRIGALGNRIPVFAGYPVTTTGFAPVDIPLIKLMAAAHDPDGDSISVTSVAWPSTSMGALALLPDSIRFTPRDQNIPLTVSFLVTFTDAWGGSVTGNITVTRQTSDGSGSQSMAANPAKLIVLEDGAVNVSFHGIPGRSYLIQRSVNLGTWTNLATVIADPHGNVTHTDPAPPQPNAYYRIALP